MRAGRKWWRRRARWAHTKPNDDEENKIIRKQKSNVILLLTERFAPCSSLSCARLRLRSHNLAVLILCALIFSKFLSGRNFFLPASEKIGRFFIRSFFYFSIFFFRFIQYEILVLLASLSLSLFLPIAALHIPKFSLFLSTVSVSLSLTVASRARLDH